MDEFKLVIKGQYERAKHLGWLPDFLGAAAQFNIDKEIPIALGSRETELLELYCRQKGDPIIDPATNKPKHDTDGHMMGYGHGLMQVDSRSHETWCLTVDSHGTPLWQIPHEAIYKGAEIFTETLREVNHYSDRGSCKFKGRMFSVPTLTPGQALRAAIAGYNCGAAAAVFNFIVKGQVDLGTTHHNYSADVIKRAAEFKLLIEADNGTTETVLAK